MTAPACPCHEAWSKAPRPWCGSQTHPRSQLTNGGYYVDRQQATPSDAARDMDAARRLWEASEMQCASLRPWQSRS